MADTKLSFAFTDEDKEVLKTVKTKLSETQGKTSNIAAIRYALRMAAKA